MKRRLQPQLSFSRRQILAFVLLALCCCGFGVGCASVAPFKGLTLDGDSLYVSGVTPIRQDKNYACGPACVAAVAAHWGVDLADFKARHPRLPADTTAADLRRLAEELGLQALVYRGSMDDLRQNLEEGRPVIAMIPMPLVAKGGLATDVLIEAWNELGPRPSHWVVVVGAVRNRHVIIDDPASGPLTLRQADFEKGWAKKGNLCVLLAAPADAKRSGVPDSAPLAQMLPHPAGPGNLRTTDF